MYVWGDKDGSSLREIARTGANCVRIVWTLAEGTAEGLERLVVDAVSLGLLPIVEFHDATGDLAKLPHLVDGWTSAPYLALIRRHERHLIVNIGNEPGDQHVTPSAFLSAYVEAVGRMREAGIRTPLMIDAPEWGKAWETVSAVAEELLRADPERNLLLSVHMWWPVRDHGSVEAVERRVRRTIADAVERDLPLVVGEFGGAFTKDGVVQPGDEIPWRILLEECEAHGIGWLAWSWGKVPNIPQADLDMAPGGRLEDLCGWGRDVVLDHPNSLRNTARAVRLEP